MYGRESTANGYTDANDPVKSFANTRAHKLQLKNVSKSVAKTTSAERVNRNTGDVGQVLLPAHIRDLVRASVMNGFVTIPIVFTTTGMIHPFLSHANPQHCLLPNSKPQAPPTTPHYLQKTLIFDSMSTDAITNKLKNAVTIHLESTVASSGSRSDNRSRFLLADMWFEEFELRNKLGRGPRQAEQIPMFILAKNSAKKHTYLNGHKTGAAPNLYIEEDLGVAVALNLALTNGFGRGTIDLSSQEALCRTPLIPHPGNLTEIDAGFWKKLYQEFYGKEGINVQSRMQGQNSSTHHWRRNVTDYLKSMGVPAAIFAEYMGWDSAKAASASGGAATTNDNAVHYGVQIQPDVTKALAGFKVGEPWRTDSYSALSQLVRSEHKVLVNQLANFLVGNASGETYDFSVHADRTALDKRGRDEIDVSLAQSQNCIWNLAAHLIIHVPLLKKSYPDLFLFSLAGHPFTTIEAKTFLGTAPNVLAAYQAAAATDAAANAGPWAQVRPHRTPIHCFLPCSFFLSRPFNFTLFRFPPTTHNRFILSTSPLLKRLFPVI